MLLALLACVAPSDDVKTAHPGVVQLGDDDTSDTGEVDDTAVTEDSGDTADTGPRPQEACWLGPDRDDAACAPTVAFDGGAFGEAYDYPPPYGGDPQYAAPDRFVDLEAVDITMAVAPNFTMDEFMLPEKGRYGVLQYVLVERLQTMRDQLGTAVRVTSGYRSPAWNAGVGGVEYSRHQWGDAADLDVAGLSVEAVGAVCDDLGASYVGLYEDGHTHCDWRDEPLDPAFYSPSRRRPAAQDPLLSARLSCGAGIWSAPAEGFDEGEPLRRWTAYDAHGDVLLSATGRAFAPPAGSARLTVEVGGQLVREADLRTGATGAGACPR